MRLFALALILILAPQGVETIELNNGKILYDTTLRVPDAARVESLLELFFTLHPNTPRPEQIEIHFLAYEDFEIELAQHEAGPNWRLFLRAYQTDPNSRLMKAFVRPAGFSRNRVEIVTFELNDHTVVHEMSHWACHTFGPEIRSGMHVGDPYDCTNAATQDLMDSLKFRDWLRDRPWRH